MPGWWQLKRREWKLQLIADIEARRVLDPVLFDSGVEYPEYTPVTLSGKIEFLFSTTR